jgi:SpoVK/Ycf46/Vps4 family AAA+-type ATPase
VGTLESPGEAFDWGRLVLYPETVQTIQAAVHFIQNYQEIDDRFKISSIDSSRKQIINFHGAAGTGKTMAAKAIARQLGKPLLQVDYAAISSKWVGESGKGISLMFAEATKKNAILFLDEADSLASKRLGNPESSTDHYFTQDKNIFMQEIDRFQGIVIMTTNLFHNYDEALLRRIAEHVKFELPNEAMRERLIRQGFPNPKTVNADYLAIARLTAGFSGGDILNLCKKAMKVSVFSAKNPSEAVITDTILAEVAGQISSTKSQHSGREPGKRIGFAA